MIAEQPNIDKHLKTILATVSDPEIPVLAILEMGVVREAYIENEIVQIKITPTYS
jgi:ring-1,2-phenylacetyl-CoA epoxidase subunit PaaD